MPRFSIIVPVYNIGKYLPDCLNSILAQSFADFEVLVVNDGSTDESPKICDEFAQKDARVKVFHKENGGVSTALNLGLQNAQGEWIYFVDGDDWIESETLSVIEKGLKKYPEVDILGFNNFYNETSREYKNKNICPKDVVCEGAELHKVSTSTIFPKWIEKKYGFSLPVIRGRWSKVFKRDLIFLNGLSFNQKLTTGQDAFFVFECLRNASKVVLINEYLYHYRVTESSAIRKYREKWDHLFERWTLTKKHMDAEDGDYKQSYGLLVWSGFQAIFKRFLFHKENTLGFFEKRRLMKAYLGNVDCKDIRLSFELLRCLPQYFPILFLIKFKLATLLLLVGKLTAR